MSVVAVLAGDSPSAQSALIASWRRGLRHSVIHVAIHAKAGAQILGLSAHALSHSIPPER
jgi:hypothetical protein